MSIFNNILEKLGIKRAAATTTTTTTTTTAKPVAPAKPGQMTPNAPVRPTSFTPGQPGQMGAPGPRPTSFAPAAPAAPAAMQMVDVVAKLDALAKKNPILDWKVSINDLMALLGMDHSAAAIKELAVELGCPASELDDSYKRNVWTHKALLKKIAENGGNIPQNLLH
jgi:hypothetical protein